MTQKHLHALFTPDQMNAIDKAAAASGIDSYGLMRRAGEAVAACALRRFPGARRYVVLCGPGNNGGDGYVAARALLDSGAEIAVYAFGKTEKLQRDAALAFSDFHGNAAPLFTYQPQMGDVVVDCIFGAGLARPVSADVAGIMRRVSATATPVLAVDLPSGVDGRSGEVLGESFKAAVTVTFMARKPGHLLLPGRALCGEVEVFDIGIPRRILIAETGRLYENGPRLWTDIAQALEPGSHKYTRGHLAVFSGGALATGAARLAATAGLRAGAGLVTLAGVRDALTASAAHLTAVMMREIDTSQDFADWLADARIHAFVLGPAFGDMEKARRYVCLLSERPLVLDADGITAFRDRPDTLFEAFANGEPRLVLTPHEGEFRRLFPDLSDDETLSKIDRASAAAKRSNAVIIYKGADTVIASPDGRAAINTNAPPWLATAGSGDVLAGIVGAHLAHGMPAYEAAAAGVWRHGQTALSLGEGLTAEDLAAHVAPLDR
ncbi:bifunctional ADP-dependent NAD(P)H-hydrate dehydratase/NAD(P)H-hydrate epimerase [Pararhizobium arenae]|uniref:bifunctional ADP-dependent NAD(P)H-hydrate dehydratase/NAD(P)H-hydrate epimerase n=1 Tax=Pararhizobium arenae TaxID=1856850 RepID=UPI00094B23BC|nr:bifunctional ADP-dependent NAD(P)H-hydrate dehydratase/NAD(P)H-hydrate epimerase [Pararhizobium arenae]